MKPKVIFAHVGGLLAVYLCAITLASGAAPVSTSINFTLDEPCVTSAGVFLTNGTLLRTLWSKIRFYSAGTYSTNWDGLDDNGNPAPPGEYQFKLLQHNTEYVWDGAIGNTSQAASGPTVHQAFYTMHDMAIAGSNAFYTSGYQESQFDFATFSTNNPQVVLNKFGSVGAGTVPDGIYNRSWTPVATDGKLVYFGCTASPNPASPIYTNNFPGFFMAYSVSNLAKAALSGGVAISNNFDAYPNGVPVGTQPGFSGMAVQTTNSYLAASSFNDNEIYIFNKTNGAPVNRFAVNSPEGVAFSPDGNLWVAAANNVYCFTNVNSGPSLVTAITGFTNALAIGVCPTNSGLILVADGGGTAGIGGGSQQIKAFNESGAPLWTYGLLGGYFSNGTAVSTNKFMFSYDLENVEGTFIAFAPNGTWWVGDGGNHRSLHFSGAGNYLEQIMWQPHSYKTCVDQNNPSRVFNQFLEFSVDYTKPLSNAWTLVNNWNPTPSQFTCYSNWEVGLTQVTTLTNGRTYGLIWNNCQYYSSYEIFELTTNGFRSTGIYPGGNPSFNWVSLDRLGNVYVFAPNKPDWYEYVLTGFDTNNNPKLADASLIASAPDGSTNPAPRCCGDGLELTAISSNGILISLDQSLNPGWHLGGVRVGSTNWLWQVSRPFNLAGCGTYEISNGVSYAANTAMAKDRQVVFGYNGEFFRSQGQASQNMNFYDDGLFIGQFGEASNGHEPPEGVLPAFAGNGWCPTFMKSTNAAYGDYYLWENDESSHGPQRWHFINARNVREQVGAGAMGTLVTITNQVCAFPVNLTGSSGENSGILAWNPVQNASFYNIYSSSNNGGPYNPVATLVGHTNYYVSGLTNGNPYYFVVTATVAGSESIPSEQMELNPFDTNQTVLPWGSMAEGGQWTPVDDVNSNALSESLPSLLGSEHLTGVLTPGDLVNYGYGNLNDLAIGTGGYLIYDWGGLGINLTNLSPIYTITQGAGWTYCPYLGRQFSVNGLVGTNYGLMANPKGTINIGVNDTVFHVLTVICPAKYADARQFVLTLGSTNGSSVGYPVNETYGYNHAFQFLFKGSVTLTANATGGNEGIVQALFLDALSTTTQRRPAPPANPKVAPYSP